MGLIKNYVNSLCSGILLLGHFIAGAGGGFMAGEAISLTFTENVNMYILAAVLNFKQAELTWGCKRARNTVAPSSDIA